VELDWALRQTHRFQASDSSGRSLKVALPPGSVLCGGDVLIADDGSLVRVSAAPQPLLAVRPCNEHGSPRDLLNAAHLLGQLGVAIDPQPDHLRIAPDAVVAALLRQRHLIVQEEIAPFEPEQPHRLAGQVPAAPPPRADTGRGRPIGIAVMGEAAPHVHGPGCGHDHRARRVHDHEQSQVQRGDRADDGHRHDTAAASAPRSPHTPE
jgi:urease accessory protein